jgi:NCS2 family nucleobase:cation symporter-2
MSVTGHLSNGLSAIRAAGFLQGKPSAIPKKNLELVYSLHDVPPLFVVLVSGLQHVGLLSVFLLFPLLIIKEVGLPADLSANVLSLAMMTLGVATLLQALPKIGSGFLSPATLTAIYLGPSLAAAKVGGLPLVFGMTMLAGAIEVALSPFLRRIRPLFPPEIGGLVIFFVGTTAAVVGFRNIFAIGAAQPVGWGHWTAVAVTLGVTVALNVWGKGQARMFCALIGMASGYFTAIATGILAPGNIRTLAELPIFAIPTLGHLSWTFSTAMILPFAIGAIAVTVKAVGMITVCQRINDAGWVRPEMTTISKGVFADGLGTIFAGLVGSIGVNPGASCIGLVSATGVASRVIAYAAGGILIALAFLPPLTGVLVLMPQPVIGAGLFFAACFILINGLQTITSRMIDTRRTLVLGLSMSMGIAAEVAPNFIPDAPAMLQPIMGSSLVLGTITALLLNGLFRLGQRQRVILTIEPAATNAPARVGDFFNANGKRWGARRDVMDRVSFGVNQAVEVILEHCEPQGPVEVEARFDEFNLDVQINYQGMPLELPDRRPSNNEIIESEAGSRRLAGFMLRRNADRVRSGSKDGSATLHFHFDH